MTDPELKLVWTLYADRDIEAQCKVPGVYACDDVFIIYKVDEHRHGRPPSR